MHKIDIMPQRDCLAFIGIFGVHAVFKSVFLPCSVNVNAVFGAERIASLDHLLGGRIIIQRDKSFCHF